MLYIVRNLLKLGIVVFQLMFLLVLVVSIYNMFQQQFNTESIIVMSGNSLITAIFLYFSEILRSNL